MEKKGPRILCVDAESEDAARLEREFSRTFECTIVNSADAALDALENDGPFAVVVSDYVLPGTNGVELFKHVKQHWPDSARVMLTALNDPAVAVAALNDAHVYRFVRKPWQDNEIADAVREAANYYEQVSNERNLREELARTNSELDERLQDLDEANELLEYWVEFSPAVLYSFSCEDAVLHASYLSKNFLRLTGYERTAAVIDAQFWPDLIHPADRPRYKEMLADLAAGDLAHAVLEYRITHKAGSEVVIVDSARAVHDGDGRTIEVVGAWMDVTARR